MVNEFKVIKIMNEALIKTLRDKKVNYEKNAEIKEYLKDETFFLKIEKEKAYQILLEIGVKKEQLENVYKKLIASDVFYELLNSGKINLNDKNLVVKYKSYKYEDLFKKNKK